MRSIIPGLVMAGLAAVAMAGYALHRGVFVGSALVQHDGYYKKRCTYLYPSGTTYHLKGGWNTIVQAENEYCRLFHDGI